MSGTLKKDYTKKLFKTQLNCALNLHLIRTKKITNWALNMVFFLCCSLNSLDGAVPALLVLEMMLNLHKM